MTNKVEVTQSARDAAAALAEPGSELAELRRSGAHDNLGVVQAIAAAEQRGFKICQDAAVKVAEERYAGHGEEFGTTRAWAYERAGKSIAAVLRTLSIKETGNGE